MTSELETSLHTEQQITDYFVLESQILSTRTADLFKALDKSRGTHISLWVYRQSLTLNSPAARQFLTRLSQIQRLETGATSIQSYGIDCVGVPFCVFPNLSGHSILQGNLEIAEADRRFISCLRIMERLHSAGIVCGDISGSSFWVERSGDVKLIGVMGSFDRDGVGETILPTSELVHFVAPEQTPQTAIDQSIDVYALGVLGYRLIGGTYPYGGATGVQNGEGLEHIRESSELKLVSEFVKNPPIWADQVLQNCVSLHPGDRYASAASIVSAIARIRENLVNAEKTPTRVGKDSKAVKAVDNKAVKVIQSTRSTAAAAAEEEAPPLKTKSLLIKAGLIMAIVFALSFAIFRQIFDIGGKGGSGIKSALDMHGQAISDDEMRQGFTGDVGSESGDAQRDAYYRKMILSDDPIYHDVLIKAAKDAGSDPERQQAEAAILDRARRLGLRRSAEVVRPWLRTVKTGQVNEAYEAVLRSLDVTLPVEARNSALRQAYANNPRVVMKLAAGLALDTGKLDQYQEVLSQIVGDATKEDLSSRSVLGIVLFSTELVSSFGDDVVQRKEQIPDKDVVWLLNILAQRNDINVRAIASLAVERKLLPPMREFYLTSIRDRDDLPGEIISALVKAAAGALKKEEVGTFGMWFDKLSEQVLLALCADDVSKDIKIEAFDILAGKTIEREPTNSLIQWVRKNKWETRGDFVDAIGIFANIDSFTNEQVDKAVLVFDPYMKDQMLLSAFLGSERPALVRSILRSYSKRVGLGRRLGLLEHPDKEVRILAVRSLEGLNDIAGLKLVLDLYAKEKDEEVKKAYKESFWVIKEKEDRIAAGSSE